VLFCGGSGLLSERAKGGSFCGGIRLAKEVLFCGGSGLLSERAKGGSFCGGIRLAKEVLFCGGSGLLSERKAAPSVAETGSLSGLLRSFLSRRDPPNLSCWF
jgi:hypothetical protein